MRDSILSKSVRWNVNCTVLVSAMEAPKTDTHHIHTSLSDCWIFPDKDLDENENSSLDWPNVQEEHPHMISSCSRFLIEKCPVASFFTLLETTCYYPLLLLF